MTARRSSASRPSASSLPPSVHRRFAVAVALCAALPAFAQAQVTYFKRPPTPGELRAALLSPGTSQAEPAPAPGYRAAPTPNGGRTRGIVWQSTGSSGSPAPATAPPAYQAASPSTYQAASKGGSAPVSVATAPAPSRQSSSPGSALMEPANASGGAPAAALPINFDLGSSRVDRESLPYIETIASLMRSDPSLQLVIEGHTDARGTYNRNMVLSWDRALGVFRTLVESYGVEPRRLQPVGKGPLEPMPGTDPEDGSNRRVQFRISG